MKQFAKQFLRDSLAIIYFIIGWKLGGCLLSEQPRRGESNGRPNRGADQFAEDASHEPAYAATNAAAPFLKRADPLAGDASAVKGEIRVAERLDAAALNPTEPKEFIGDNGVFAGDGDGFASFANPIKQ